MGRPQAAAPNAAILRLVLTHVLAVIAEWASIIAVLVLVFERSGAQATGVASIGLLLASLATAPVAGSVVNRMRPQRARMLGLVAQASGFGIAAAGGLLDLPLGVVMAGAMVAQGAATVLRPSAAVLMPAHARSSAELVLANLWMWYVESISVLVGPLLATGLLATGGPSAALVGCAGCCLVGAGVCATDLSSDLPPATAELDVADEAARGVVAAWRALRGRPGLVSVLAVVYAQYVMIGALDFVLVVVARDELGLGPAGPGVLSTAFGAGAVVTVFAAGRLVSRPRLAAALGAALIVAGVAFAVFGLALTFAVALVALPILGMCRSLLDGASRMMLQRSVAPESLGSVFTIRELGSGLGMITGGVFALAVLEVGDPSMVFVGLGVIFVTVLAVAARGLRVADDSADVPVVEMSLLCRVPMFAPLPAVALEAVARSAATVAVAEGGTVITQGDPGDRFYVVVDGTFDVTMSGRHVRLAGRHEFFGEVALLADVPRTASVVATTAGTLLAIDRGAFLVALTGTDSSHRAAWSVVRSLDLEPHMLGADLKDAPQVE